MEVMKNKKRMCESYEGCGLCDLGHRNNGFDMVCSDMGLKHPQETEEIIMKWAEEHPAKTNADKFKEVFGFETDLSGCAGIKCIHKDDAIKCCDCEVRDFWNKEYKAPGENE